MPETFGSDFRRFFLRGLAAVLPTIVTLMIILYVFNFVRDNIGGPIDTAVQWVVIQEGRLARWSGVTGPRASAQAEPAQAKSGKWDFLVGSDAEWDRIKGIWGRFHLSWVGILLAFVAIYIIGRFAASIIGRALVRLLERALVRLPMVRQIYPSVKQVTDFLLSERKPEFSRVVMVEYPRKGCWSLGLVTGPGMRTLHRSLGAEMLTIFVPSSPTPVTGYTITVERGEVIDLPLSIDDAMRFTVSAGVIVPQNESLSQQEIQEVLRSTFSLPPRKETAE